MVTPRGDRETTSGNPDRLTGRSGDEDWWGYGNAVGTGNGRDREDGVVSWHAVTETRDTQVGE